MNFWTRPNMQAVRTDDTDDPGQGTGLVVDIPEEPRVPTQTLDVGSTYDHFPGISTRGDFENIDPDIPAAPVPREDQITILRDIRELLQSSSPGMQNFVFNDFLTLSPASGEQTLQFHMPFRYLLIPSVPRDVSVFAGAGRSIPLGQLHMGETLSAEIPIAVDSVTLVWDTGAQDEQIQVTISSRPIDVNITGGTERGSYQALGQQNVTLVNSAGTVVNSSIPNADGISSNFTTLRVLVHPYAYNGSGFDRLRTPVIFKPLTAVAIGVETTIWTPAAGKRFRLMGFLLQLSGAANVTFRDNTGGTIIFASHLMTTPIPVDLGNGILSAAVNNVLTATASAAANLTGTVWGTEE